MFRLKSTLPTVFCLILIGSPTLAEDNVPAGAVKIRADFPGGNIQIEENSGGTLRLTPDLRGDRPWFYWYFEATATKAGRVRFVFPDKVINHKNGAISFQGPAISTDGGKSWRWMGTDTVDGPAFYFDFDKPGQQVRFAVAIPYLQQEFDAFLKRQAGNAHLKTGVLTKSREGRDVEMVQIGELGDGKTPVLVTGRHHAAETIASYVLEGFLAEAMSDSAAGKEFRKRYVLYGVPFVDKDGVENGDQGKNRKPHDHNRDYGETSIYPEVQAIRKLDQRVKFKFALDFHCPTLVMDAHQVFYFVGAKAHPQHNEKNVSEFAKWIKAGLPKAAPVGPMVWLRDEHDRSPKNSRYFAFNPGVIMSATIEIPFAPPKRATDAASCRKYGAVMLQAFVETHFLPPEDGE